MFAKFATTKKVIAAPAKGTKCYACDADSTGIAMHSGATHYACKRHADPSLRVVKCCIYCGDPTRKGSLVIDGDEAHHGCHAEANPE